MAELRGADLHAVIEQLGRPPLTDFSVVARCPDGHPLVIRNHPVNHAGNPFPTLYWLTCPEAVKAVSRVEAGGAIARLNDRADEDAEGFGAELAGAHRAYARERARGLPEAEAWGGVTGSPGGIKCLHAHYAHHLAGGPDPAGAWTAEQVEPFHPGGTPAGRVAAVDMGTNSIRLLVADPAGDDVRDIAKDMVITRLGTGVDRTGRFDEAALQRTIDVLETYARRARALHVSRIRVGATSAVRDAANRDTLLAAAERLTGSPLEVLTGEREAGLSFLGATTGLDAPAPRLVLDIGGGSTELVMGDQGPDAAISVDMGSVRVHERVAPSDPATSDDLERMTAVIADALKPAEAVVPTGRARTLVAVAGTVTTIQAISLGLDRYDPDAIHRTVLRRDEAERVTAQLARMTVAERAAMPVMAKGREDVIVGGCLILLEVMRRWGFDEAIVSERDILDGLAIELVKHTDGSVP